METAILNSMCRCCASEGVYKDVKTSYTWMGEEEVYADMLREIFDISLSTAEHGEDGGICEVCITQLRNAANFKKQVLHTEEQFKKHVNHKLFKPSIVKVEALPEDDNDSDDNNVSAEEGFSGPEFEVPIKTETEEQKPKKRAAAAKATTSRAKKAKNDNGESSTKRQPVVTVKEERNNEPDEPKDKEIIPTSTHTKTKELFKHRTNIKEVMLWSNATPIRRVGDMGYVCCYCNDQYLEPESLKIHTIENHKDVRKAFFIKHLSIDRFIVKLDITSLRCKICDQNIDSLNEFLKHLKLEHKKPIYTDMKNHIIPFKFTTETLQCCICTSTFDKFRILLEHMNTHHRNYVCDVCDVAFVNNKGLQTHMTTHNPGIFKCGYCAQIFDKIGKKKAHERTIHSHPNYRKCAFCNESFSDFRLKEVHLIETHGLKVPTPKCQACEKVFKSRKLLRLHIRKDHLMERQHKCPECDKSFFESAALKIHMVKHTGLRSYKCTICSKAFGRPNVLRQHMNIHDDDRKYKCDQCEKQFAQKCSWKSHMKIKHGRNNM